MKHQELCNSWPNYHPYDCPECKIIEAASEIAEDNLYEQLEEARNEGYSEAEDTFYWEKERIENTAYDEGKDEGIETVLNNPEKYGLVKNV